MAHTIQEIHELPDAMPVLDLAATVAHIAERKSGTSKYGSWSIQFLTLEDGTGRISVMAKDRPEDFAELDWIGKRVVVSAYKSDKHGWQGALAHDNDYKDKAHPERVIKLTRTGRIELAEGQTGGAVTTDPSQNGAPKHHRRPAEQPTPAAPTAPPSAPQASPDDGHNNGQPSASTVPEGETAAPERMTLEAFLVLTSRVYDRCSQVAAPDQSATLTSMVMEQVAQGHLKLTEDEHLRILLRLHDLAVEQFCEFINVSKGENHEDLTTVAPKIKRKAIARLQADPLDLIEKVQRTVTRVPADSSLVSELRRRRSTA